MCTVDTPHTLSVRRDPARKNVHDDTVHGNLKSGRLKSIVEGACHSVQQLLSRGLPRSSREREGAPGRSCTSYCSPSMGATPRSTQTSGQTGAAPSAQGLLPGTWMVRGGQAQGAPGPPAVRSREPGRLGETDSSCWLAWGQGGQETWGRRGHALRLHWWDRFPDTTCGLSHVSTPRRSLFLEMKCLVQGCIHRC